VDGDGDGDGDVTFCCVAQAPKKRVITSAKIILLNLF
jgi:hypothetical protein